MNERLTEEYASKVFHNFAGSYADYYVECCKEILVSNPGYRPYDVLIIFPLYNM